MNATELKVGDAVKWAKPLNADEAKEVFKITELNGDRCFIEAQNTGMTIAPVQLARVAELVKVS